jgi:hypothetical protein
MKKNDVPNSSFKSAEKVDNGQPTTSGSAERFKGGDESIPMLIRNSVNQPTLGADTGISLNPPKNSESGTSESGASNSTRPKWKQSEVASSVSNGSDGQEQEVPEGYVTHYQNFACRPVLPLAPEPAEWNLWRTKEPTTEEGHPDSRNARYAKALRTNEDRAWPLPYESYVQYVDRQMQKLGRPQEGFNKSHVEYLVWMTGDRQFHSTNTIFLEVMRRREWVISCGYYGRLPCRDGKCNACGGCLGYGVESVVA